MSSHDIIVIGASAGGVEALKQLVRLLPAALRAAVFVVLHIPAHSTSVLPAILQRAGHLPVTHAVDGEPIASGRIYVAPPDYHMLVKPNQVVLSRGPKENNHRPAVDPLFRSAAHAYGPRVIGVVLSGALDDGTAGMTAIKAAGGLTIAQNPEEAMYSGMPQSAIQYDHVDYIVSLAEMPELLLRLVSRSDMREPDSNGSKHGGGTQQVGYEAGVAEGKIDIPDPEGLSGAPSGYICPDCGGALWEIQDGKMLRYRCRTGHAFGVQSLLASQTDKLEEAFWVALRALEESASLSRRMAERSQTSGHGRIAAGYVEKAQDAEAHARLIRDLLLRGGLRTILNPEELE